MTSKPATEAAPCRAVRTTLAGSTMPAWSRSTYSSVCALNPKVSEEALSAILPTRETPEILVSRPHKRALCQWPVAAN
jgi:hypothetical protein